FQIAQVEYIDRAGEYLIVDVFLVVFEILHFLEGVGIGERGVDAVLRFRLLLEVFVLAGDVGVPPGAGGGDFERPDLGGVRVEKFTRAARDILGGNRGKRMEEEQESQGKAGGKQQARHKHECDPLPAKSRKQGQGNLVIVAGLWPQGNGRA